MFRNSLLLFITLLFLQGCEAIYIPTPLVPTGFKNKKDLAVTGTAGINGYGANVAYSPLKNFYVHGTLGHFFQKDRPVFHTAYAGGIGVYYPIFPSLMVEAQGQIGRGNFYYLDNLSGLGSSLTSATGNYNNWNSMISLIHLTGDKSQIGIAFRYGWTHVNYESAQLPNLTANIQNTQHYGYYFTHRGKLFKRLHLVGSYGRTKTTASDYTIKTLPVDIRIGLEYRL